MFKGNLGILCDRMQDHSLGVPAILKNVDTCSLVCTAIYIGDDV